MKKPYSTSLRRFPGLLAGCFAFVFVAIATPGRALGTASNANALAFDFATGESSILTGNSLADANSFPGGFATSEFTRENAYLATSLTGGGISMNEAIAIPEPSTYAVLSGLAMLGFAAYRRRS